MHVIVAWREHTKIIRKAKTEHAADPTQPVTTAKTTDLFDTMHMLQGGAGA